MSKLEFIRNNFDIPNCACFATGFLSATHRCPEHNYRRRAWFQNVFGDWHYVRRRISAIQQDHEQQGGLREQRDIYGMTPRDFDFLDDQERKEDIARSMKEWKHQATTSPSWWTPNPKAPEFIPQARFYNMPVAAVGVVLDEKKLWIAAEAEYEEVCSSELRAVCFSVHD
ncbi:MAG: hypothetical protein Q9166_005869 [cf. Caloplaca sp. 2 TL-2023]